MEMTPPQDLARMGLRECIHFLNTVFCQVESIDRDADEVCYSYGSHELLSETQLTQEAFANA